MFSLLSSECTSECMDISPHTIWIVTPHHTDRVTVKPQTYSVSYFFVTDRALNDNKYYKAELDSLGFTTSVTFD